jgi:hypothetical protein
MTLPDIMEKLKTVSSSAYQALRGKLCYFMQLWKTALSSIVYRLVPSSKEVLSRKKFLNVDLMSWSSGIEDSRAWRTEDTDKFFYEIEEKKK